MSVSTSCAGIFDLDDKRARIAELERMSAEPDFWNDAARAQALMRERTGLGESVDLIDDLSGELADVLDLVDMADAEQDQDMLAELDAQVRRD